MGKIRNLLYKQYYDINQYIRVMIPSVGEVIDNEDEYYNLIFLLTAMPIDMMVQLDDNGVDFTKINEYDLFLLIFEGLKSMDTKMVFGDMDLQNFQYAKNTLNENIVLVNPETGAVIDKEIHAQISTILRKIHNIDKNNQKPANVEAKEFMLKRARAKLKRKMNQTEDSQLETLIVAMVNTEQYKYTFEETRNISIYQFNESVRQIIKKTDYDNKMYGVYTGTINAKELSQKELNWLTHK